MHTGGFDFSIKTDLELWLRPRLGATFYYKLSAFSLLHSWKSKQHWVDIKHSIQNLCIGLLHLLKEWSAIKFSDPTLSPICVNWRVQEFFVCLKYIKTYLKTNFSWRKDSWERTEMWCQGLKIYRASQYLCYKVLGMKT